MLLAGYPMAVWGGLSLAGSRWVGLVLLAAVVLVVPARLLAQGRRQLGSLIGWAIALSVLPILTLLLDDRRFILSMPVLANAILLGAFGSSLTEGRVPAVERFARVTRTDLSPARVRHCRAATKAWCLFFVVNGLAALALALFAPVSVWALYTGVVSYVLIGMVWAGEYAIRKIRFG